MKFRRTDIPEIIVIEPSVFGDHRGYFSETYKKKDLEKFVGYPVDFIQENESKSSYGVLRGLHFQLAPYAQTKLVRVFDGKVLDVAVDIRRGSKTYGKYVAEELSAENRKQMLIPRGFAHGFIVLSENATFGYKVDNYYSPENDRGIAFDDTDLNINWQISKEEMKLSEKDIMQPRFKDVAAFSIKDALYE